VQAGVEIGADVVGGHAGDDEAVRAEVVDMIVADFRDVFLAAGELPGAGPEAFVLGFRVSRVDIALGVDVLAAHVFIGFRADPAGRCNLISGDDVLRALRGAAGLAGGDLVHGAKILFRRRRGVARCRSCFCKSRRPS